MKRVKDRPTPVYRCPCCAQVLELVGGSLRRVWSDHRCRACGHNRGSHLPGWHCIGGPDDLAPCACAYFHEDSALLERAALAGTNPEDRR